MQLKLRLGTKGYGNLPFLQNDFQLLGDRLLPLNSNIFFLKVKMFLSEDDPVLRTRPLDSRSENHPSPENGGVYDHYETAKTALEHLESPASGPNLPRV